MNLKKKFTFSKETHLISYKLLHDALFLALLSFGAMLVVDGLIPRFISSHISYSRVIIAIMLIMTVITLIGKKFQITYEIPKIKKNKLIPFLILFAFLLIGNSLLKFSLWANLLITIIVIVIFFLLYELIFLEKE